MSTVVPLRCHGCRARHVGICEPITDEHLDIVEKFKSGNRILKAGTDLFREGEYSYELYNLLDGWVYSYHLLEDGRRQILEFILPGAFVGFESNLRAPLTYSAQCLTEVAVCVFPREKIPDLFREHPELAIRMTRMCAKERMLIAGHLTSVGRRTARERVACLLTELYNRLVVLSRGTKNEVTLPLTQEHIGDALGLSAVHVSRTLRDFRAAGWVTIRRGEIRLHNPSAVAQVGCAETIAAFSDTVP